MTRIDLLIGGKQRSASQGATFERMDPISGQRTTLAAAASADDAVDAANVAAAAFPSWSESSVDCRRQLLNRAADLLLERTDLFIEAMVSEVGAHVTWAQFNVTFAVSILRDAASMTTQICGEVLPSDKQGSLAMAVRQPVGVCLGIAPWNAPVLLGVRAIAMPLACGNSVILKASELCPRTHHLIGQLLVDAGFPDGTISVISNAPNDAEVVVEALLAHPSVRRVNFTGSTRVGRVLAQLAARHLKRCLLELGGKAPLIVLADADIAEAVKAAAFGAFMNQGQICMSTERIIVHDDIADEFAQQLTEKSMQLRAGDPMSREQSLGAMIGAEAAYRVCGLIDDAVGKGAVLLCGGIGHGAMMDATVLDNITPAMNIYNEEVFGPVASIIRVGSIDEAVTIANDSEYGLSAAVFGRDLTQAMSVAKRIESGMCHINSATVSDEPQMPFGGVKASGYGRFGGKAAIDEFTELRWITVGRLPATWPI